MLVQFARTRSHFFTYKRLMIFNKILKKEKEKKKRMKKKVKLKEVSIIILRLA